MAAKRPGSDWSGNLDESYQHHPFRVVIIDGTYIFRGSISHPELGGAGDIMLVIQKRNRLRFLCKSGLGHDSSK